MAVITLALLAAVLVPDHPASAQTDADSCAAGGAVTDAANNPGLVSDCDTLLAARDTLAGTATLNWSASTPIDQWEGITLAGSPLGMTGLALGGKGLTGSIPAGLGSLRNLDSLLLAPNQLTGCIPKGLRDVADNDLDELGLPYCDVLLSDLTVSPGSLVPQFDPYRTDYSASVGLLPVRVTVIPTNDHDATFLFLDENDGELTDADNRMEGLQIHFGVGFATLRIRVTSQDELATHTYTITDLFSRYDANNDGVIDRDEVISAIKDYFNGLIARQETIEVIKLYFSAPPSPSEMINALAWVKDGTTETEERGVEFLNYLASRSPSGFRKLMSKPWIRDDLTAVEIEVVNEFRRLAYRIGAQADELIVQILDMPFLESIESTDDDVTRILVRTHLEEPGGLTEFLADPRLNSGITDASAGVVLLIGMEQAAPEAAEALWAQPWIVDGITKDEVQVIGKLVFLASEDLPFALAAAEYFDVQKGDLAYLVIDSLTSLWPYQDAADRLKAQPWFADGLDHDEAALVVTLYSIIYTSPELYDELLDAPHTQHKTVSVPLAGDVNIWVIENAQPPPDEDILGSIADAIRITEGFLGVAFPRSDVILLVANGHTVIVGHYGSHMVLSRFYGEVYSVPHETAHYFLHENIRQFWLREGGAQFAEAYVNDQTGVRDLEDRKSDLNFSNCFDLYENIRHLDYMHEHVWRYTFGEGRPLPCHYYMGEYFLLNIFEAIGNDAMSAALKELYLSNIDYLSGYEEYLQIGRSGQPPSEDDIYYAFLNHAPSDRADAFRDLYQRLHGGSVAFPVAEFSDDHGDEASLATGIAVGETIEGALDYMFDFDYFRFHGEKDQKFRMNVIHESIRYTSVTVFATNGLTQELWKWKSRSRVTSGPQILWVAPTSGDYYFAVQNFGGETGTYTVTITAVDDPPDDHGDTLAAATDLSFGEVVDGTIEDDFDFDYFGFEAVEGRTYDARITTGTLDRFRLRLYAHGGAAPLNWHSNEYWDDTISGGGIYWVAPRSGQYYIAIDGYEGDVGTYTLTITEMESDSVDGPATLSIEDHSRGASTTLHSGTGSSHFYGASFLPEFSIPVP